MHSQKKEREPQYVKIILSRKYYHEVKKNIKCNSAVLLGNGKITHYFMVQKV